jgi:SapC
MTVTDTSDMQSAPMVAPLFYSSIEPLSAQLHKAFKVRADNEFGYAAKTNTVPLTVPEFTMAARHYPILLLGDDLIPTAAVGIKPEQNLFVDADGKWDQYSYIPAYVRRHPFILLSSDDDRLTLGIDSAANAAEPKARALFDDAGKETEVVNQSMEFCSQFHNAFMFTRDFSEALKKNDLVIDCQLEIEPQPGQRVNLGSFKRIDEEKFKKLSDATIQEWFKNGFMHACYFLLQSMNNWDLLLTRAGLTVPIR